MNYFEIRAFFEDSAMHSALAALDAAVVAEAKALSDFDLQTKKGRTPSGRDRTQDAQDFLAEDICAFLNGAMEISPDLIVSHRPRVTIAWALAELIKKERDTK